MDKLCFGFDKNTFYPAIKDELQKIIDEFNMNFEALFEKKEKEVMS